MLFKFYIPVLIMIFLLYRKIISDKYIAAQKEKSRKNYLLLDFELDLEGEKFVHGYPYENNTSDKIDELFLNRIMFILDRPLLTVYLFFLYTVMMLEMTTTYNYIVVTVFLTALAYKIKSESKKQVKSSKVFAEEQDEKSSSLINSKNTIKGDM